MKIIYLDTEVSPQFSAVYGKDYEASVLHTELYQYMFCFSYKVNNVTKVVSLNDFPLYKRDPFNDREVIKELYKVLSTADLVVCHNVKFDIGFARQRFIFHNLPPIKPFNTFCTMNWARNNLKLNSNSLKSVALYFRLKHKMETSKGLWERIHYAKDGKAWKEMIRYNKIDTIVLSQIYDLIEKWTSVVKLKNSQQCRWCKGYRTIKYGFKYKVGRKYQRYLCQDCGHYTEIEKTP